MGNFIYQEEDEYSGEEYDNGLDKHRKDHNELLLFNVKLEFVPVKEES